MKKIKALAIALCIGGVFVAGVAVGKETKQAKYIARDEIKFKDLQGPKLGVITGDSDKGPYSGLLQIPGGFESPWHSHTGSYEAVMVSGTSKHWVKGEDGAKAKKLPPGSYWTMPGGVDHISACEKGPDCVMFIWQSTKFDFVPGKDAAKPADPKAPAKAEPPKKM